jgi:hypothetical protein
MNLNEEEFFIFPSPPPPPQPRKGIKKFLLLSRALFYEHVKALRLINLIPRESE